MSGLGVTEIAILLVVCTMACALPIVAAILIAILKKKTNQP